MPSSFALRRGSTRVCPKLCGILIGRLSVRDVIVGLTLVVNSPRSATPNPLNRNGRAIWARIRSFSRAASTFAGSSKSVPKCFRIASSGFAAIHKQQCVGRLRSQNSTRDRDKSGKAGMPPIFALAPSGVRLFQPKSYERMAPMTPNNLFQLLKFPFQE